MYEVSLFRLYLLRAMYLLVVVGLGIVFWPGFIHHAIYQDKPWELMRGVENCMLAAFSLLCVLGLRYPLQMLPILLWELIWKTLWLSVVALPLWLAGTLDERTAATIFDVSFVVLVYLVMPWTYLFKHYLKKPSDRWKAVPQQSPHH